MPKQAVTVGQRYRDTQSTIFGAPGAVWIVEHVEIGVDGVENARLVSAADRTERKTLSTAALTDRQRFVLVRQG
jgi:hypothetical protein